MTGILKRGILLLLALLPIESVAFAAKTSLVAGSLERDNDGKSKDVAIAESQH